MPVTIYEDSSALGGGAWTDNDGATWVPNDPANKDRARLQALVDTGEAVIAPWVPPPPPAAQESPAKVLALAVLDMASSGGFLSPALTAKLQQIAAGP